MICVTDDSNCLRQLDDGLTVLQELAPGRTYRVRDASGRQLVYKRLDDDCLLHGQLHPSIRERLARVREVAHKGVASLHGVERRDGVAYLDQTALKYRVFTEIWAARTLLLPKDLCPPVADPGYYGLTHA